MSLYGESVPQSPLFVTYNHVAILSPRNPTEISLKESNFGDTVLSAWVNGNGAYISLGSTQEALSHLRLVKY